ncbi:Hypothetical protein SMAX5B_018814 [Scophthalmus maximus]|uniref:Uncharacterized protein n=1 Tax=Scophthalmus maximus TaxID=52904 RepID=A0A2U9BSG7_SCOMX|nr:Hypothetical protein SMAX5B_018814 [Scophthalmus maximus]
MAFCAAALLLKLEKLADYPQSPLPIHPQPFALKACDSESDIDDKKLSADMGEENRRLQPNSEVVG